MPTATINRFNFGHAIATPDSDGQWVRWLDHVTLVANLEAELEQLRQKIKAKVKRFDWTPEGMSFRLDGQWVEIEDYECMAAWCEYLEEKNK